MWMLAKLLGGGAISLVQTWLDNRKKKAETKAEAERIVIMSDAQIKQKMATGEIDYNITAQKQMEHSWKDEYLTIILSLPFIGSFIPTVQDYVMVGWGYVTKAPQWYQMAFMGVIVASFGLRGWFKNKSVNMMK